MKSPIRTAIGKDLASSDLVDALRSGVLCSARMMPTAAQAYLAWKLFHEGFHSIVLVTDGPPSLDTLYRDLVTFSEGMEEHLLYFPARESIAGRDVAVNPDIIGDRLGVLRACTESSGKRMIATCIQALLHKTTSPAQLRRSHLVIEQGKDFDRDELVEQLDQWGYAFGPEIHEKGRASQRGGIVDVWPMTESWPVRIEFFGSLIDSMRHFGPVSQRSRNTGSRNALASLDLLPARDMWTEEHADKASDFTRFVSEKTTWIWSDIDRIRDHAHIYEENMLEADAAALLLRYQGLNRRIRARFNAGQLNIGDEEKGRRTEGLDFEYLEEFTDIRDAHLPDIMEETRGRYVAELVRQARSGDCVHFYFNSDGMRERFLETQPIGNERGIQLHKAPISEGFRSASRRLIVVAESDLYGRRKILRGRYDLHARRSGPRHESGPRISDWSEIEPGDLVVHMDHGIGKYLGLYEIDLQGQIQEVITIEYAEKSRLYVPVTQTHLLSRYVGVGKARRELHRLGGRRWMREKLAAQAAVQDLAASLLETQAARQTLRGYAFSPDTPWQEEFESTFPYEETKDQEQAIREVKFDMEQPLPMDRLVCGDAGYGKTEVAMRATFKAVMDGKQVAVLVPTTVLAQQHYTTFRDRMAAFPVSIEMLSRFRTRDQQQKIVAALREGLVDIVIGTHRLIQEDVVFRDLGLVIIDEEQRFGVVHKEHLKQLRRLVDVLTLSATPIPRTLYMSITGAKEMSTIQTPPRERLPIETIVVQYSDELVRSAILRELGREGQVFYLHNRVKTIEKVYKHLQKVVPEARIAVGHGQMSERTLEKVVSRFVEGEIDVLLCTTIIESGVDIPNVNTILIDRADRFGLADLYQLRGRVGRYKHRAYAYLLLPRHGRLFDVARKRIRSMQRYSSLGAGFKVALRDLEIRGAGNILGPEQSGQIAAVGFDLYCQFLKRSIAALQGEKPPPIVDVNVKLDFIDLSPSHEHEPDDASIPFNYIEDEHLRLVLYRRFAGLGTEKELNTFGKELRDRFGPPPDAVERLLNIIRIRVVAAPKGISHVEVKGDKMLLLRNQDYLKIKGKFPRLKAKDPGARLNEILQIIRRWK